MGAGGEHGLFFPDRFFRRDDRLAAAIQPPFDVPLGFVCRRGPNSPVGSDWLGQEGHRASEGEGETASGVDAVALGDVAIVLVWHFGRPDV